MASLDGLTEEEARRLGRTLADMRSPVKQAWRAVKTGLAAGLVLYALSGAVQTYRLTQSDAFACRKELAAHSYSVGKRLAEDDLYVRSTVLYLKLRGQFDEGLDRDLRHLKFYAERERKTRREFEREVERIYNPLAMLK